MTILIKGGHVIDPGRWNGPADLLIENGTIAAVSPGLSAPKTATADSRQGTTGPAGIHRPACAFSGTGI